MTKHDIKQQGEKETIECVEEWRSGEQREINNRAKCEDHGHIFQQTLLKTVGV